ncbi:hypothetical protein [Chryseobacterium shigense]|uniref:Uncharacterized protein n=1 Tax=Chryseobacterium shigense TaxID=297244 RepID=A0A841NC63_9FLAO|nr:hypothetical protein [Chryseobacterium shigense]MBB6368949.1 hypothetical protein [Chryseobacterium shigense]
MIKPLKFFILLICMFSCKENDYDSKNTAILDSHISNFPSESTKHFPKKVGRDALIIYNEDLKNNSINLYLAKLKTSDDEIDTIIKKLNTIKAYRGNDNKLLIINKNEKKDGYFSEFPYIDSSLEKGEKPLPNFVDYDKNIFSNSNYEFYIIHFDNKKRIFKKQILNQNASMPNKWKNGITYGIAVDKTNKNIVYWVAIW